MCAGTLAQDNAVMMHFTATGDGNGLTRVLLAHVLNRNAALAVRRAAAAALGDMLPKLPVFDAEALDNAPPLPQARALTRLLRARTCLSPLVVCCVTAKARSSED